MSILQKNRDDDDEMPFYFNLFNIVKCINAYALIKKQLF